MNKKRILASALAAVMLCSSAAALGGCGGRSKKAQKQTVATVAEKKTFETNDILKVCSTWLGQMSDTVGMTEEYVTTDGGVKKIIIKGSVFGKPVKQAYATFADGADLINSVFITPDPSITYDKAREELVAIYGEPKK